MIKINILPESITLIKMSDEDYFNLPQYKKYISNSKLALINPDQNGSEELYMGGFKDSFNDSFEVGSAVHSMTLQPSEFFVSGLKKPSGKLGLWCEKVIINRKKGMSIDESTKQASIDADYYSKDFSKKRWYTAVKGSLNYYLQRLKDDKTLKEWEGGNLTPIFLSEANRIKFESCMRGIAENSKFNSTLFPTGLLKPAESFNEYAIFCDIEVIKENGEKIILQLKAKLDNFTIDFEQNEVVLNDLKTTGKPVNYFMGNNARMINEDGSEYRKWIDGSFQKYHYHRQLGLYLWLLQCYCMKEYSIPFKYKANMLVVETIPNFKTKIYAVPSKSIKEGLNEFKKLIELVSNIKNDE